MDTIIFGGFTLKTILIFAGIGLVVIFSLIFLVKLLSPKKISAHVEIETCKKCGWEGQVSRYAGRCPKCNEPLGSQEAKRQI